MQTTLVSISVKNALGQGDFELKRISMSIVSAQLVCDDRQTLVSSQKMVVPTLYLSVQVLLFVVFFLLFRYWNKLKLVRLIDRLPGPISLPVFGNSLQLAATRDHYRQFCHFSELFEVELKLNLRHFLPKSSCSSPRSIGCANSVVFTGCGLEIDPSFLYHRQS